MELEDAINRALKKQYPNPALSKVIAASSPAPAGTPAEVQSAAASARPAVGPVGSVAASLRDVPAEGAGTASLASAGSLDGNTYRNARLGLSYQFPKSWVAAALDALPQEAPANKSDAPRVPAELIFYASMRQYAGEPSPVTSVRILTLPVASGTSDGEFASDAPAGYQRFGSLEQFKLAGHGFVRVSFSGGPSGPYVARTATTTAGFRVLIELRAPSRQDLESLLGTIQSLSLSAP